MEQITSALSPGETYRKAPAGLKSGVPKRTGGIRDADPEALHFHYLENKLWKVVYMIPTYFEENQKAISDLLFALARAYNLEQDTIKFHRKEIEIMVELCSYSLKTCRELSDDTTNTT